MRNSQLPPSLNAGSSCHGLHQGGNCIMPCLLMNQRATRCIYSMTCYFCARSACEPLHPLPPLCLCTLSFSQVISCVAPIIPSHADALTEPLITTSNIIDTSTGPRRPRRAFLAGQVMFTAFTYLAVRISNLNGSVAVAQAVLSNHNANQAQQGTSYAGEVTRHAPRLS